MNKEDFYFSVLQAISNVIADDHRARPILDRALEVQRRGTSPSQADYDWLAQVDKELLVSADGRIEPEREGVASDKPRGALERAEAARSQQVQKPAPARRPSVDDRGNPVAQPEEDPLKGL